MIAHPLLKEIWVGSRESTKVCEQRFCSQHLAVFAAVMAACLPDPTRHTFALKGVGGFAEQITPGERHSSCAVWPCARRTVRELGDGSWERQPVRGAYAIEISLVLQTPHVYIQMVIEIV